MTFFAPLPFVWRCSLFLSTRETQSKSYLRSTEMGFPLRWGPFMSVAECELRVTLEPSGCRVHRRWSNQHFFFFFFCSLNVFQAWRRYDTDRSGYIEANELKVRRNTRLSRSTVYNILKSHPCTPPHPPSFIDLTHVYSHFSFFFFPSCISDRATKQPVSFLSLHFLGSFSLLLALQWILIILFVIFSPLVPAVL